MAGTKSLFETNELIAVADANLRVVLTDPKLIRLLNVNPVGEALHELFPKPDLADDLRLLKSGIGREARLMGLPGEQMLVASLATAGSDEPPSILVRARSSPPAEPSSDVLVGRVEEQEAFDDFLAGPDGTMFVVEGPLGIGKTALLAAFQRRCFRIKAPQFTLDARAMNFEGDVLATVAKLHNAQGSIMRFAGEVATRPWVLMLDHFDVGLAHSTAERAAFFRSLPESCRLVLATRSHAKPFAFLFPRHRPLMCHLGPLDAVEASELGRRVGAPERATQRAYGHPLSIRAAGTSFAGSEPLDDLAYDGDLPVPRFALKVAAMPRRITEDLLATLLGDPTLAATTYDALGSICMHDTDNFGLRMPEVLRNALTTRLERRNPSRYAELRLEIIRYLLALVDRTDPDHLPHVVDDLLDSFEGHGGLRRLFGQADVGPTIRRLTRDGLEEARSFLRVANRPDAPAILARFRSGTSTYLAEQHGDVCGLLQMATFSASDSTTGDDRRRSGVRALLGRYANANEVKLNALLTFVVPSEETQWGPVSQLFAREHLRSVLNHRGLAGMVVVPELGWRTSGEEEIVEIDGHRARFRNLQLRSITNLLLAAVNHANDYEWRANEAPPAVNRMTPDNVRQTLLGSGDGPIDRLLLDALEAVSDTRQRDVLRAIYVERRGKHEVIAAEMGVPYSTFRRLHTRGLEQMSELLNEEVSSEAAGNTNRETRSGSSD